jgi:hypothetical protein
MCADSSPGCAAQRHPAKQARSNSALRTHTNTTRQPSCAGAMPCYARVCWWVSWWGSLDDMQGVRGSNPLSSTPGQRPCSASTAPESPASGSRWAAICVAGPIQSSDAAGGCCCRRPGRLGPAGGSVVSHGFAARSSPLAPVSMMQPMQSRWPGVSAGCPGSNPAGGSAPSMRSAHPSALAP